MRHLKLKDVYKRQARCEVDTIHERHDTLFGGKLPAPTAATLRPLQNFVLDGKCDIGIATDGDADRLGVIDDKGKFLHPNDIMVLLYYYLVKYKGWQGPVVRNICTTHMLDKVAQEFGEKCYEVPVGFKHKMCIRDRDIWINITVLSAHCLVWLLLFFVTAHGKRKKVLTIARKTVACH